MVMGRTYRVEGGVDVPIGTIGERGLLEIDLDVIGRRGGGTTALWFGGIQQHLQRGDGVQLRRLLVHFAWNIIFVIVIVCGFFFFFAGVSINNAVFLFIVYCLLVHKTRVRCWWCWCVASSGVVVVVFGCCVCGYGIRYSEFGFRYSIFGFLLAHNELSFERKIQVFIFIWYIFFWFGIFIFAKNQKKKRRKRKNKIASIKIRNKRINPVTSFIFRFSFFLRSFNLQSNSLI